MKSINVSPSVFSVDETDKNGWQQGSAAMINDLANNADLPEFNQENSAYLQMGEPIPDKKIGEEQAVEGQPTEATAEAEQSKTEETAGSAVDTVKAEAKSESDIPETGSATTEPVADQPAELSEHSLIFKDFSLPFESNGELISNIQLRLSLAVKQTGPSSQLKIFYKTIGEWQDGGQLQVRDGLDNQSNNGFFLFALPVFTTWDELKALEIKVVFLGDQGKSQAQIYLDGAWLEIDYQEAGTGEVFSADPADQGTTTEAELPTPAEEKDYEINRISADSIFKTNDNPDFNFVYKRKQGILKNLMSEILGVVSDQYSSVVFKTKIKDSSGELSPMQVAVDYLSNGEFHVRIMQRPRNFKPGRYTLEIEVDDNGQIKNEIQTFDWGVLAINTNKSVYVPAEKSYLQMAVLDERGDTICDADLFLEVTAPDGGIAYLDTYNGLIKRDPNCGPNNVIDVPDYHADYGLAGTGVYKMKLTAHTKNGDRTIYDQFEVRDVVDFDIERIGPTRIWPMADYKMEIKVKASSSASDVYEVVPKNFIIEKYELRLNDVPLSENEYEYENYSDGSDGMVLHWKKLGIKEGDVLDLVYTFDAPDVSPEFYLLGPAKVGHFEEARQWQIASDAVNIFNVNAGTAIGAWNSAANAWDSTNDTRAWTQNISVTTDWPAKYLKATGNTAPSDGGAITSVEIGVELNVSNTSEEAAMRPLFNGTATGTEFQINPTAVDAIYWTNITSDAAGPGAANWTWTDIDNLDVAVYGITGSNNTRRLNVDQIYIRVTSLNGKPTNFINSLGQKNDGSGLVDLSVAISDTDGNNTKVRVDYEQGDTCAFTVPRDSYIATAGTSSTFGTFIVDNTIPYQIGSTTGTSSSVFTASGTNTINFDWDTKNPLNPTDLSAADGVYCMRVTANDGTYDATSSIATTTLDNVAPTAPGVLTLATTSAGNEIAIIFGSSTIDTNFKDYRIYYKAGSTGVTEGDTLISSTSMPALGYIDFANATSSLLGDLLPRTEYVFNIWAYDKYGNKASSTEITITTGKAAPVRANNVSFFAGRWTTTDGVSGQLSDTDQTLPAFNFSLAENGAKIKDAYIVMDATYNAYVNTAGNYTGYKMAFDTCQEPCTANAFTGVGNVTKYDPSVLSYRTNTAGSHVIRLLLDVTDELQLAQYNGNGQQLQGQIGYRFERGAATTSISAARALLYVTYKYYENQSENYTNTVVYPLESTVVTDTGTRRAQQSDDCVKNSTCPLFRYNMAVPEVGLSVSQWFEMYGVNYDSTANSNDVTASVNIQGTDMDSVTYIHEAALNGGQGSLPPIYFSDVQGFAENTAQQLEYRAANPASTYSYFLIGGEVKETYVASSSAATKTRTVSYPIGVINNGGNVSKASQDINVFFPENGLSTGTVSIKKAWVRVSGNYYNTTARSVTVFTKVGSNAETSGTYNIRMSQTVPRTAYNIVHVIPASGYPLLENANSSGSTTVTVSTQASNALVGGTAGELMITYTYTSETSGRTASLNLFAGQSESNGNATLSTSTGMTLVLPEQPNTKTILAGALLSNYLVSSGDNTVTSGNFTIDANLAVGSTPVCTNSYYIHPDGINESANFYKNVKDALTTDNGQVFSTCYSITDPSDANAGAKTSGQLLYTYRYDTPLAQLNQNNWRWYANADDINPTVPLGDEKATTSGVNVGDILRLRMNINLSAETMTALSRAFDLQYATGTDCSMVATSSWSDVGLPASASIWRGYTNSGVVDGSSTGMVLLQDSSLFESYESSNPSALNPYRMSEGENGEWDWVINNNGAEYSKQYCFRMANSDGSALTEYLEYPKLVTAPQNTPPGMPYDLSQTKGSTSTDIGNGGWTNDSSIKLGASTTDVNINQSLRLFFELATSTSLRVATTVPTGACSYGTAWTGCASRIWAATSSVGDYRISPFATDTLVIGLPEDYTTGYKWQVLACDDFDTCSNWSNIGSVPNFRLDLTPPQGLGSLTTATLTPTSVTLNLGAQTTEQNFGSYKIFYKIGTTSVTENNMPWLDANLLAKNYNGTTTTSVTGLTAGTTYAFNIWAYDLAGNKSSSTILVATTTSSYTPPLSSFNAASQRIDGTGAVNVSINVDDPDNDDTVRAKLQYEAGASCAFTSATTMYLNSASTTVTATNLPKPVVDNGNAYQLGTTSGFIKTSPGPNIVTFDWLSKEDIGSVQGTYCIRLVVNDGWFDSATTTRLILLDNVVPTVPTSLSSSSKTATSLTLSYGSTSLDTNFDHYAIFYSTSSPVSEADFQHSDINLNNQFFNGKATTTISGLEADTEYYINIWAYDYYGNRSSSTQIMVKTDAYPNSPTVINQYKADGASVIANGEWTTESTVKLAASTTDPDQSDKLTLYYQLIMNGGTFATATTVPANACNPGVDYMGCASHIWQATSTLGDYSSAPFVATATITNIPASATGYKWQVLSCDSYGMCSDWTQFDPLTPNFKVDLTPPTAPGALTLNSKTSISVTLNFGSVTTEANFSRYRLFYSTTSPVLENAMEKTDTNLNAIDYNSASLITIENLNSSQTYYFSLWAYDQAGQAASSTPISVTTNAMQSTPGVVFYAKTSGVLYYRVWSGSGWGPEKPGPTLGSAVGDNIRHLTVLPSDDKGKVAIVAKTWDGGNQEWWATVYRVAADDFATSTQLGAAQATAPGATQVTSCIGALSSGEFFVVRNNNGTANPATLVYSWNSAAGWQAEGNGPNSGSQMYGGCRLVRRPNTDNHLLITFDNRPGVGTAYYNGSSTYSNSWTNWTQQTANNEYSVNDYVGEGFFDHGDNTRGAFYTGRASTTAVSLSATRFTNNGITVTYGAATSTPEGADAWAARAAQGEFATDPGSIGIAYFAGRDTGVTNQLNVYRLDITGVIPVWSTTSNGKFINSPTGLYSIGNASQKPFAISFYKNFNALLAWNLNTASVPQYTTINSLNNTVSTPASAVPGAPASTWTRVRLYNDPNEIQTLAVYQDTNKDYDAIFWNGDTNQFFSAGNQAWTNLAAASGVFSANDDATAFSFASANSVPNTPTGLVQYKANGTTTISNGGWTNQDTVVLNMAAHDPDTSENLSLYLQLVDNGTILSGDRSVPAGACASTTSYTACGGKIWLVNSSILGDYSAMPFTATATISGIPDNAVGYKWQVMACDKLSQCSNWAAYNPAQPNFKVDATAPTNPGNLTINSKTSNTITLNFGASSTEANFLRYQISYSTNTPVKITDASSTDANLGFINYNGKATTTISGLASSTLYYFRIWVYDMAGNIASSALEVSTTTDSGPKLYQASYVFENDDDANVNANSTSTNASSSLANMSKGERFGVRIQIDNRGGDKSPSKVFKLQFENQTDAPGVWTDVGAATAISYSAGLSGVSGDAITSRKAAANARTWSNGAWYSSTNLTGSYSLNQNSYTEFVFMLQNNLAAAGKTYRLRLYNNTDSKPLDGYDNVAIASMSATDNKRFSKGMYASLPTTYYDGTYYLDRRGYADVAADDNVNRDPISSTNYPVFDFMIKNTTNTQAITSLWNGQSSVGAGTKTVYLQAFHFGTTNAWETIVSTTTPGANVDFSLSGTINAKVSEYYDALNFVYWRVYQDSGTQTLRTDYATSTFSAPTPAVTQKHFRWRNNNGTQTTATWLEAEDTVSSTVAASVNKGQVVRLRVSVANLASGPASNYNYQLEYSTTSAGCAFETGAWRAVPTTTSAFDFRMSTTTAFTDQSATTKQMADVEGYTFGAGKMVRDPNNRATNISLLESYYTENEYAFLPTAVAVDGGTYCFRVTNNGMPLSGYDRYGEITLAGNTNNAPAFTVMPSDGAIGTTSPLNNMQDTVTFTGTAVDADNDDYYLAICQAPGITPGNNAAPICRFGTWCVSGVSSSSVEANCSYAVSTSTEIANWYAYACDDKSGAGISKCSLVSQGGRGTDEDSPFFVNHAPTYTALSTQVDFQDPGSTFTIRTTSADTDVVDSADTMSLYICKSIGANSSGCAGGAGDTVCSSVGVAGTNISCAVPTPIPSSNGATNYYGYIFDSHGLAASSNYRSSSYTINNVAPTLGSLLLNNGQNINLSMRPNDTPIQTVNTNVVDLNGCDTLVSAVATVYMSSTTYSCISNTNLCYPITTGNCIKTGCSAGGTQATYTCSTTLKYYALPTDAGSPYSGYNWLSWLRVFDGATYISTTSPAVELITGRALDVVEPVVDFGSSLTPGQNTGNTNQITTVINAANSPISSDLKGSDMFSPLGGSILAGFLQWSLANGFNYGSGNGLSNADQPTGIQINRATSTTDALKRLYWGIGIPGGAYPASYNGSTTFTVTSGSGLW